MPESRFDCGTRVARITLAVAMAGVALIATARSAQATPIVGIVSVTQVGANVNFDIVLNAPFTFDETADGGGGLFFFNDNGIVNNSIITNIVATVNGTAVLIPGGLSGFTNQAPVTVVGYGTFDSFVECTDPTACIGGSATINDLHFTVTNATIADLVAANARGNIFFVGTNPPVPVPEPATLTLLALGLGLGVRRRMRR